MTAYVNYFISMKSLKSLVISKSSSFLIYLLIQIFVICNFYFLSNNTSYLKYIPSISKHIADILHSLDIF